MDNVLKFVPAAEYGKAIDQFCRQCVGPTDTEALIARCDHLCPLSTARAPSLYMSD